MKKQRARRAKSPKKKSRIRLAGHAGMPRERWRDWRQVAETFVAERRSSDPKQVVEVLTLVLRRCPSWTDFLAGVDWLMFAFSEVYTNYVRGYGAPRTFQLLDRFVRWLLERGDIDEWRFRAMQYAIDQERRRHGHPGLDRPVVKDLVLGFRWESVAADFARTLEDGVQREMAPSLVGLLRNYIQLEHGRARDVPMGALDPERVIPELVATAPSAHATREALLVAAGFYRWAGDTERLEPTRAEQIAARFSAAALGLRLAPEH